MAGSRRGTPPNPAYGVARRPVEEPTPHGANSQHDRTGVAAAETRSFTPRCENQERRSVVPESVVMNGISPERMCNSLAVAPGGAA